MALGLMEVTLAERLVKGDTVPVRTYARLTWGSPGHGRGESPKPGRGTRRDNRRREVAMDETIHGTTMPVLELTLQPGESVVSEAGQFSWMSDAIQMKTNTGGGMGGKGVMGRSNAPSRAPPS